MIRNLENKDIDQVMDIWIKTNIKTHNYIEKEYWENNLEDVKFAILNSDVYVFESENTILGFIGIVDGYIAGIFVKEDMQNKGIGKQLINKCKNKYNNLTLRVYERNKKAINFYIREGFKTVNTEIDKQTSQRELLMRWDKFN